ncbi:acyltransferase family protein [Massilia sp. GCM10020059]|uniref:Acyltransferase n=1 Tax=Massilia agrisoli TaxID=2892444 RepID=A0ABS8IYL5_9BURK|nr:acyltransferase [Massilia agrisoli]MCC6072304.1 acyltransferase [Massilia agrisoli]
MASSALVFYSPIMSAHHPTRRLFGLDTLRALAIVLVVFHHYTLFVSRSDTFGWIGEIGWVGVDLFFALSGYLIGNQIFAAMRSEAGLSLPRFYARRFLRTLPNFYVVLALYALWPWFRGGLEMPPLWEFLTFTQNINLTPGTAFSHAWSLCIEEQFYVLLPALALLVASLRGSLRWAWFAVALAFAAGMVVRATLWQELVDGSAQARLNYYKYIYYSTFCRFDELVAGVALALLKNYHQGAWRRITANGNVMMAAGASVCAVAFWLFLDNREGFAVTVVGFPLLALGFALLIVAALSERSVLRDTRVPGATSLALWAYAIYLTHKQIGILAREPMLKLGYPPGSLVAIMVIMALSLLSGWLLFKLVETPFMALRDRYVPTNSAPPVLTPQPQ